MNIIDGIVLTDAEIKRVLENIGEPQGGPLTNGKPCKLWMGSLDLEGYGRTHIQGKTRKAHRLIFAIRKEDPGNYPLIRHMCHNPPCCEEAHLLGGTRGDNKRDAMAAGRHSRGEKVNTAKLTEEQVREIIKLKSTMGPSAIAEKFGVNPSQVHRICTGKTWTHVSGYVKKT